MTDTNCIPTQCHNLIGKWDLYYHLPHDKNWDISSYKIIVDEFIKLMKLKENKNNNNDLFLKLVFKIREFRTKVLNYNYGNRKFSTFDKKETLEIFQILKELNPRFDDLSIDFLKKDIIYIKKNS